MDYFQTSAMQGDNIDDMMKQMHQHDLRELSVGEGAEDTTATLLDDSDSALDVADMFRSSSSVDNDVGSVIHNLIELIVHQNCLNGEACTSVNSHNPLKEEAEFGS